jgi:orotate phosphoribosyltransferase
MGDFKTGLYDTGLCAIQHKISPKNQRLAGMLERLKEIILEKSFQYSEEPVFKLAYAGRSNFYFNCKTTVQDPEAIEIIARLIFERIKNLDVSAIGGLEVGAIPISIAVTLLSQQEGKPTKSFFIRKEMKGHGVQDLIAGELKLGERVVVVDDVITTGKSTIQAIEAIEQIGAKVQKVIILVDREESDGKQNIQQYCEDVEALITRSEIMDLYNQKNPFNKLAL